MSQCAQYVTPNDLELFNDMYTRILGSIAGLLSSVDTLSVTSTPIDNQQHHEKQQQLKLAIVCQLLSKFSFASLKKLLVDKHQTKQQLENICTEFVQTNMRFLLDLNVANESVAATNLASNQERQLRPIVEQCVDNMVCILHVDYPLYFDYMLKRCLEFSASSVISKYGTLGHWSQFVTIMRQHELLFMYNTAVNKPT